tara:strand:- start:152 stop:292 length:141 start_codon:yes stop_codon:yes gene_type:complete
MKYTRPETIQNYDLKSYLGLLDAKRTGLFTGLFGYLTLMVGEEKSI